MSLPASGQIDMNQVNVELGLSGTAAVTLNDAAVRALFAIAAGAISLDDGHGKSAVSITAQSPFSDAISPTNATAVYELRSDGSLYTTQGDNTLVAVSGEWKTAGAASDFEARVLTASLSGTPGTLTSGTLDTWEALSTTRTWTRDRTSIGTNDVTFTVAIRRVSDSVEVDSAVVTLTATKGV